MGTFQVGLLLIGTFALLLALSVPVSVSIIISSVVTMASTLSLDLGAAGCPVLHPLRCSDEHRRHCTETD